MGIEVMSIEYLLDPEVGDKPYDKDEKMREAFTRLWRSLQNAEVKMRMAVKRDTIRFHEETDTCRGLFSGLYENNRYCPGCGVSKNTR